jgi:transposase, IS5 family
LLTNGHLEKPASHEIIAPSTFQFLKLMIKESLFAAEERETKLDKLGDVLQVLEKHVDFAALAAAIDKAAPRASRDRGGRPPFPTEIMVRTLLLQQLYNLSDERLEFQLLDRLSFQRFVGLRHSSQISDRTTFWTFRERLLAAGASETIFEAANRELDKHGYLARGGQIIDASIVPAPKQCLRKGEKALIKEQAMPFDWPPAKRRQKDIDATWTKKQGHEFAGSYPTQGKQGQTTFRLSKGAQYSNRQNTRQGRTCVRQPGTDGGQRLALHWPGSRHPAT